MVQMVRTAEVITSETTNFTKIATELTKKSRT